MSHKIDQVGRRQATTAGRDASIKTHLVEAMRSVGVAALVGLLMGGSGDTWAVQKETSTEKAEHLRQQANPELFNDWTFDKDQVGEIPKGFTGLTTEGQSGGAWKVETQSSPPSSPNVVFGVSRCAACVELLVAQGFQYEYPDLVIRIHQGA
ncbi:MAG: hypothetical protein H0V35_02015, partial [Nitrospira sp.]|nr:hypothetical protein [Nitrospira sp.]